MTYIYEFLTRSATSFRRTRARIGRLAGGLVPILCLLVGGMIAHDAQGQQTGVTAIPLGDSFVFFVDKLAPTGENEILLKVGGTGAPGEAGGAYQVVNDPKDGDNRVIELIGRHGNNPYQRFYFADSHDQGVPRDLTANRTAGDVLSFRILVDPMNPKEADHCTADADTPIICKYRLSIQFEDYGPDDNNGVGDATANPPVVYNYPFRLRWAIPDNMRNGEWHNVSLRLPPATWSELQGAKADPPTHTVTPALSDLEKNWIYAGSWAGNNPGLIGLDLLGPMTTQHPALWTEFEWDNVESVGIQWDWGNANEIGHSIYLDDVYIGPAGMDLSNTLQLDPPPAAVTGVNFKADGNSHVISWTHDTATTPTNAKYKIYASHSPITDLNAQGVGLALATTTIDAVDGAQEVRVSGELPHPSLGNTIYYAVTSLNAANDENKDVSGSSGSLKAGHSPAIVQLTAAEAATLKANIAAGNVSSSGFPATTMPFTINKAHSVATVGSPPEDSDLSASVYVGYSDANEIYIYAEVTDDDVLISPVDRPQDATWKDDAIEFLWGNYDVRDAGGSIAGGSTHDAPVDNRKIRGAYPDYQVRISMHGATAAAGTIKSVSDLPGGTSTFTNMGGNTAYGKLDVGDGAYAPMTGGYKILHVLPVADIKDPIDSTPAFPGANDIRYSPMSITLNDKHGTGEYDRDTQITWSLRAVKEGDSVWKRPAEWQTVAMVGRNVSDTPQAPVANNPGGTKLLRIGGGNLSINLDTELAGLGDTDWTVHHYQVAGADAVNSPGDAFVVGSNAWVQLDDRDIIQITPTGAGAFKIAFQPADATDDEKIRPIQFEVMSADAPMLQVEGVSSGAGYNGQSNAYVQTVELTLNEKTTADEIELYDQFTDPDNVTLAFSTFVGNPNVATATLNGSKLRISLTDAAKGGDATDVWAIATDPGGEYARLRIGVNVDRATKPYVVKPLEDIILREGGETETKVHLYGTFADGDGESLTYEIKVSDESAVKIGTDPEVYVTSYMRTEVNHRTVGPNSDGEINILPLGPGSVNFTVIAKEPAQDVGEPRTAQDIFTLTVVSKTSPMVKTQIADQTMKAEDEARQISMADVDAMKDGDQPAFEAPDNSALSYSATSQDGDVVRAGVRGGVLTLTPAWSGETRATTVTVTATNENGESWPQTFTVTVQGASNPIVNPKVQPILNAGIPLKYGDEALVLDLTDIKNPLNMEESLGAVFIDPNANPRDVLPGGFHLEMGIEDVQAAHRYDEISAVNDVYTSAMHITLDPMTAVLKIVPTAANHATITIRATDRELKKISATMTVTVDEVTSAEGTELPTEVSLSQNYPNPFNPQTTIEYALPEAGDVSLIVYDMLGREVSVLLNGPQAAGEHTVRFDANDLPNGSYVYRLVTPSKTIARSMVLVK